MIFTSLLHELDSTLTVWIIVVLYDLQILRDLALSLQLSNLIWTVF